MVDFIIEKMSNLVKDLQEAIKQDIEDIKQAKHEELLKRNDNKHFLIDEITSLKEQLNEQLVIKMRQGVDVNIYRTKVDLLELDLKELYKLNRKLAALVLPIQKMYKDLVEEITLANGGQFFDVKA